MIARRIRSIWARCFLSACALAGLAPPSRTEDPPCPPIAAEVWVNHVGQAPTLEALRGRPLLLGELRKATLHELIELQDAYASRGLVVLAVSSADHAPERVDREALYAVPFPIGFGSETERELEELVGLRYASAYLVDSDGRVVWAGQADDVPKKEVRAVLRGVRRPRDGDLVAWRGRLPDADPEALEHAAAGELGRALARAAGDAKSAPLREALVRHIEDLATRIDAALTSRRDLAPALAALEPLVEALEGRPEGMRARRLAARVRADETLADEMEARKSLLELIDFDIWRGYGGVADRNGTLIFKKGYPPIAKTKDTQLVRLIRKHAGTLAATRAELLLEQLD